MRRRGRGIVVRLGCEFVIWCFFPFLGSTVPMLSPKNRGYNVSRLPM